MVTVIVPVATGDGDGGLGGTVGLAGVLEKEGVEGRVGVTPGAGTEQPAFRASAMRNKTSSVFFKFTSGGDVGNPRIRTSG